MTTKVLFVGDVFSAPGVNFLIASLPQLIAKHGIDFIIVQGENISNRKGLALSDYELLKASGVNVFTMGNHVWANQEINTFITNGDVIRPFNVDPNYPGVGTNVFLLPNGKRLRVSSLLGMTFNELTVPWREQVASNFFDAFDEISKLPASDFHIIDFHGETTSEKSVFSLYVDGHATAVLGTHTHVQTNDARMLPGGTLFITDVGMTGPANAAIGADYNSVYQKMRFNARSKFTTSLNPPQLNAVVLEIATFTGGKNKIKPLVTWP